MLNFEAEGDFWDFYVGLPNSPRRSLPTWRNWMILTTCSRCSHT